MDIKSRVREFIAANFYIGSDVGLTDEASLLDRGIVDSTGVLELVAFVEHEFSIRVEDREMVPQNLDSIDNICAFVARKLDRAA